MVEFCMNQAREKWRETDRNQYFLLFFSLRFEFPDRPKYENISHLRPYRNYYL